MSLPQRQPPSQTGPLLRDTRCQETLLSVPSLLPRSFKTISRGLDSDWVIKPSLNHSVGRRKDSVIVSCYLNSPPKWKWSPTWGMGAERGEVWFPQEKGTALVLKKWMVAVRQRHTPITLTRVLLAIHCSFLIYTKKISLLLPSFLDLVEFSRIILCTDTVILI